MSVHQLAGGLIAGSIALALLGSNIHPAPAAEFCLVRDGKPAATIVTAAKPVHAALFAAVELQYHVEKITGAVLPIVSDDVEVTGLRILVGASAATAKLDLPGNPFKKQEYLVRFLPEVLVLMGNDAPEMPDPNVSSRGDVGRIEGKFGRGLNLNGRNAAVSVKDSGFRDEEGTLEAWVRLPAETQSGEGTILRLDGSNPWTYHIVRRTPNASSITYITYDGSAGYSVTSGKLGPGWHHVMCVYSAAEGKMELFVDGSSQGTAKYVKTTCKAAPLGIGGIARSAERTVGNPLCGAIDEVRISTARRTVESSTANRPAKPDARTALLLHFDESEGEPQDTSGVVRPVGPPQWCDQQGTSYAVHDFLERFCDVRWYGPTELEMVCPKSATLCVTCRDIRRIPAFALRCGHLRRPMPIGRTLWNDPSVSDIALFWARLKVGGEPYACNHSFYGFYDRYWKKNSQRPESFDKAHPDWFAQGYKGRPPQMCFTNEGFIMQVIQDARDYFDGKGAKPGAQARGDFFALVPMDNNRWCKCPRCQAELDETKKEHPHFTYGYASDYIFNFVNKVAREVGKTHPGKYLATIAYHDYSYYPERVKVEPNVSVMMCLHTRNWWAPCMETNDMKVYRAWVANEKGRPLYLWNYYCFPELWSRPGGFRFHCFPGFFAHAAARQIKMFARDGIRGISTGGGLGEQVDTYVSFKLFDNPTLDVDKLLDEFFTRYYGAAAEPMKRLYLRIEEIYSTPTCYSKEVQKGDRHFHQTEEMAWKWLGTEERMAELGKLMDQAVRTARTDVEKQRVALFEKAVWQHMLEGRRKWLAKQKK